MRKNILPVKSASPCSKEATGNLSDLLAVGRNLMPGGIHLGGEELMGINSSLSPEVSSFATRKSCIFALLGVYIVF